MSPVCYMPTTKTVVAYSIIPTMRYAGFSRSWRWSWGRKGRSRCEKRGLRKKKMREYLINTAATSPWFADNRGWNPLMNICGEESRAESRIWWVVWEISEIFVSKKGPDEGVARVDLWKLWWWGTFGAITLRSVLLQSTRSSITTSNWLHPPLFFSAFFSRLLCRSPFFPSFFLIWPHGGRQIACN